MFGRSPQVRHWPWIVALLAVTTAAFLPIVRNDFVNYDDPFTVQLNDRLLSPGVLQWAFTTTLIGHYQPFAWIGWASVASLFGTEPGVFHALSLAVHLIDAVLIYLLAMRLASCGGFAPVEQRSAGIGAAGAFAIHPMRVEVVAWASAFPYTLSLAWLLASTLAYMRYAATVGAAARIAFGGSLACYACSLMSRSIGLGFPLILLALDVWPLRRRTSLIEKLPFLSLAVLSTVVETVSRESTGLEEVGLGARLTAAVWSPFAYLSRMLWPVGYSPIEVRPLQPQLEWTPLLLGAAGLTVVSFAVWRWRHRRPAVGVAWAAFILLLAPVIGLTPSGQQTIANRYAYFPAVAVSILAGGAITTLVRIRRSRRPAIAAAIALAFVLGAATWRETFWWRDSRALWTRALTVEPSNDIATYNLAVALEDSGRKEEAIARYEQTLTLIHDHEPARRGLARLRAERGLALVKRGRFAEAAPDLRTALAARPADLALINSLSFALAQAGESGEAVAVLKQGLKNHGDNNDLAHNLARLLATAPAGVRDGQLALRLALAVHERTGGRDPRVLDTLAAAYAAAGQPSDARRIAEEAWTLANELGDSALAAEIRAHSWGDRR